MRGKPPAREELTDAGLVAMIRCGDRQAESVLIVRWQPLIERLIGQLNPGPQIDFDDLRQLGRMAILETARAKPPKGWSDTGKASFKTYVYTAIQWALQTGIRANSPRYQLEDGLPGGIDGVLSPELVQGGDKLAELLGVLLPVERAVVQAIWGLDGIDGKSSHPDRTPNKFGDVAAMLGLTRMKVQRLHSDAMAKLRMAARPG